MCVKEYAYYVNKLRLKTWIWRQIVTSQTVHTKHKWPPYTNEWTPSPLKIFCVRHCSNSFKYNEGNVIDVCFKCLMKRYRTFWFSFWIKLARKWSHWENWIQVAEFDDCPLAKCYWHSSMLDLGMLVWRCPRRKPIRKTAWFCSMHIMYNQYHTLMQKWNEYSAR